MADRFEHSTRGNFDQWSPESIAFLKKQAGDKWGGIRDSIAGYRSGANPMMKNSEFPGYDFKVPEDQRLIGWLLQSLMTAQPNPPMSGVAGKDVRGPTGDIDFGKLPSRAGGGYTNQ